MTKFTTLNYLTFTDFRKMNEHLAKSVLSQLSANKFFPGALVRYLEDTELEDLSGDALILLVNIFDD